MRERTRALFEKLRFDIRGEAHWVEPSNWITRAILAGEFEPRRRSEAPAETFVVAPLSTPGDEAAVARAG